MSAPNPEVEVEPPPPHLAELSPPLPPTRLSADLDRMLDRLDDRPLTIGEVEGSLQGRGFALLLMLLALPFCVLPVPGLSVPFGVAVFLIGMRLTFGQQPWLPARVRRIEFQPDRMRKLLIGALKLSRTIEKFAKPRMEFLKTWPGMTNLIGFGIAAAGLLLLLPLPIPFSNWFPAWAVVLLTAGMIERDGLLVLLGYFLSAAGWGYVVLISLLGAEGVGKLWDKVFL